MGSVCNPNSFDMSEHKVRYNLGVIVAFEFSGDWFDTCIHSVLVATGRSSFSPALPKLNWSTAFPIRQNIHCSASSTAPVKTTHKLQEHQ